MKTRRIAVKFLIISTFFVMAACAKHKMTDVAGHEGSGHMPRSDRTEDITFKKGKLIEVAYLSVKEGKGESLKKHYFPKAMALVKEYDAKMLGRFRVIKKTGGEINPQMVVIFEWPSVAEKEKFSRDPRFREIKPIRDAALSFLKLGYYEMGKDTTITFKENKVYEFFGAWIDSNDKLNEYFKVSGPIKKNYGRPEPVFKTMLGVIADAPKGKQTYSPQMAGIVEWDKSDDFFALMNHKDFKRDAKPLLDAATTRLDLIHTQIMIATPTTMSARQK